MFMDRLIFFADFYKINHYQIKLIFLRTKNALVNRTRFLKNIVHNEKNEELLLSKNILNLPTNFFCIFLL